MCHHKNAPNIRRQCAKAIDQWAQGVANRPNSLAGRPHYAASHRFASRACSLGSSNKESEAWSQWKLDLVVGQPRG
jgi:hypothetical protein